MRTSLTFGYVAGIPLKIHLNWILIAIVVTWSLAAGYFPQEYPSWRPVTYWALSVMTAILFFASVLAHEIAHALIALQEGVPVKSITLFILGGVAHIAHEPESPGSEFRIVAAGPLTSILLTIFFYCCYLAAYAHPELSAASFYLCQINLILAVFNLIPGFPLDGGRILRAGIWKLTGDFYRATQLGRISGLVVALLFGLAGIGLMVRANYYGGLWLAFIGWYLGSAAQESYRQAMLFEPEDRVVVRESHQELTRPLPRYSGET
jgi:Zn-dependent protease